MHAVLNATVYVAGDAAERAMRSFRGTAEAGLDELDVDLDASLRDDGRIAVDAGGEDAEAAIGYLVDRFGRMTTEPEEGERYLGTLETWDADGFTVDVGTDVRLSAEALGDLGPGDPSQIRERYGLVQHVPLEIRYGDEPSLTEEQVDELWSWRKGPGRLNVNSVTRSEIRATVNRAGHADDVVTIERLGLLEQSVVCTEGTDPPGLLAAIGEYVRGEMRCVVT
jgi:hypothetical protein